MALGHSQGTDRLHVTAYMGGEWDWRLVSIKYYDNIGLNLVWSYRAIEPTRMLMGTHPAPNACRRSVSRIVIGIHN